jgi:uncharacterized protein (DUF849 family)
MAETIISCAVTGNITTLQNHPGLPVTPAEIAEACLGAAKAGAAICHIHVRDPKTGAPSMSVDLYRQVVELIRARDTDVIINLTTGPGGRFIPSDNDPQVAAPGSSLVPGHVRVAHVVELKPDVCSLDLNTMFSGRSVVINTPQSVTEMAEAIYAAGTLPELEVFDTGDIHLAADLIQKGVLKPNAFFQIVTGIKYGASSTPATLAYMKSILPVGSIWSAFGIGAMEFPMVAQSYLLGGHVRVGLEDNVYLEKGVLAPDNAALVEKAARIVRDLGGSIATPRDARRLLNLPNAAGMPSEVETTNLQGALIGAS